MKYLKLYEEYSGAEEEIHDYKKSLEINEGLHGSIIIYGKNEGENKVKLGYAGTIEAAEDLENDFKNDFDDVWLENDNENI